MKVSRGEVEIWLHLLRDNKNVIELEFFELNNKVFSLKRCPAAVGSAFIRTTEQATEEEINWVLDVNYVGVIHCTKAVIAHMRKKRSGHIINVTSVGRLVGQGTYRYQIPAL